MVLSLGAPDVNSDRAPALLPREAFLNRYDANACELVATARAAPAATGGGEEQDERDDSDHRDSGNQPACADRGHDDRLPALLRLKPVNDLRNGMRRAARSSRYHGERYVSDG